jgi:hypothetical protein
MPGKCYSDLICGLNEQKVEPGVGVTDHCFPAKTIDNQELIAKGIAFLLRTALADIVKNTLLIKTTFSNRQTRFNHVYSQVSAPAQDAHNRFF